MHKCGFKNVHILKLIIKYTLNNLWNKLTPLRGFRSSSLKSVSGIVNRSTSDPLLSSVIGTAHQVYQNLFSTKQRCRTGFTELFWKACITQKWIFSYRSKSLQAFIFPGTRCNKRLLFTGWKRNHSLVCFRKRFCYFFS